MKKPDSVIFKKHLMKLSLEELTAYLKEYEKVIKSILPATKTNILTKNEK